MVHDGPEHDAEDEQTDDATDIENRHVQVIDLLADGGRPARHVEPDLIGKSAAADEPHHHSGTCLSCIVSHIALPVHVGEDGLHSIHPTLTI